MATRQNSSSGKPKSPRIQVVLPEDLCNQLSELAAQESRTVSNMAKVLIQDGIKALERKNIESLSKNKTAISNTENFISNLEKQETRKLKGVPRRIKFLRP